MGFLKKNNSLKAFYQHPENQEYFKFLYICPLNARSGTCVCMLVGEWGVGRLGLIFRVVVEQGRYVHRLICIHEALHLSFFIITSLFKSKTTIPYGICNQCRLGSEPLCSLVKVYTSH